MPRDATSFVKGIVQRVVSDVSSSENGSSPTSEGPDGGDVDSTVVEPTEYPPIECVYTFKKKDGETIKKGQKICQIIAAREIVLTAERTALNFIQMLSGISTKTNKYVRKLNNKKIKILDTRKTIPGLRFCQKYAVKIGGGYNHRSGLYDQVLFKENHISSFESFSDFILSTQKKINLRKVSIEVENLKDLEILCKYNPKNILLDNFSISQIKKAIKLCSNSKSSIEISGNISLSNIGSFTGLKIDYISIGDLTKNVESIDFSLLIEK